MTPDDDASAMVRAALELLERQGDELEDDDELIDTFCQSGFLSDDAHRLVALLPLAFGRATLQQMGFAHFRDDASVHHPDGTTSYIRLSDQPIFQAALQIAAASAHHGTPTSAAANALAHRSVELMLLVHASQSASQSGERPDPRGLAAPMFHGFEKDVFAKPPWWRRRLF